MRRSVVQVHL